MNEEYVEKVLSLVEQVPAGRVTTYGALAAAVGSGGPRQVGAVMSSYGGPVPWWRVVRADGRPAECHDAEAVEHLRAEGVPLRASGRVELAQAMWWPQDADLSELSGPSGPSDLSVPAGEMSR